jgi:hypothetical protein
MIERRASGSTARQCARFGCSAVAVATFTFDSATRTVWLDTPLDGNARAGELCGRHARSLTPPRGWRVEDRRGSRDQVAPPVAAPRPVPAEPPVRAPRPEPFEPLRLEEPPARPGTLSRQLAAGPECNALEDELRGLLDAHGPLLSRAFRSSGTV